MVVSEIEFKRWFWCGWHGNNRSFEFQRLDGAPDIQLRVRSFEFRSTSLLGGYYIRKSDDFDPRINLYFELKLGEIREGYLHPKSIRMDEIDWHYNHHQEGGDSVFLIGVPKNEKAKYVQWKVFAIAGYNRDLLIRHEQGWPIERAMDFIVFKRGKGEKIFC